MSAPKNENAKREPGNVVQIISAGAGTTIYNERCTQCGARSHGHELCEQCLRWRLAWRHTRAAKALLKGLT